MPSKISRLLALSDAEFKRKRSQPSKPLKSFKAKPIDVRKFDGEWQRQRGAAVKLMAVVLREDSDSLYAKVSATPDTAATFADAIAWLLREGELLRKTTPLPNHSLADDQRAWQPAQEAHVPAPEHCPESVL